MPWNNQSGGGGWKSGGGNGGGPWGQGPSGGGQPPKWLSTHPSHEDRINDLRVYAEKVAPLYTAAKGGAAAGR